MDNPSASITAFVKFVRANRKGDEKGEAQIYCDRLFQAFGHSGIYEAGGTLEYRVHQGKGTKFADLLWRPRLLLEMKKKGEKLEKHYQQAFEYWLHLVPNRPEYVVLCNFDEFWIYNLNYQLDEPMGRKGDGPRSKLESVQFGSGSVPFSAPPFPRLFRAVCSGRGG